MCPSRERPDWPEKSHPPCDAADLGCRPGTKSQASNGLDLATKESYTLASVNICRPRDRMANYAIWERSNIWLDQLVHPRLSDVQRARCHSGKFADLTSPRPCWLSPGGANLGSTGVEVCRVSGVSNCGRAVSPNDRNEHCAFQEHSKNANRKHIKIGGQTGSEDVTRSNRKGAPKPRARDALL
ncbi:unnamed protein product [Protopolystoma xenopodis]|uniref:Uncharacterized protein n=1 Tax=Protopolystoma xenopodis TaxID=117903 RepID=A0A3S5AXY7_9PLAT|nr:unnamed protein product [Protopolystoma xenopodis]